MLTLGGKIMHSKDRFMMGKPVWPIPEPKSWLSMKVLRQSLCPSLGFVHAHMGSSGAELDIPDRLRSHVIGHTVVSLGLRLQAQGFMGRCLCRMQLCWPGRCRRL